VEPLRKVMMRRETLLMRRRMRKIVKEIKKSHLALVGEPDPSGSDPDDNRNLHYHSGGINPFKKLAWKYPSTQSSKQE
jgi:hypothetical protein